MPPYSPSLKKNGNPFNKKLVKLIKQGYNKGWDINLVTPIGNKHDKAWIKDNYAIKDGHMLAFDTKDIKRTSAESVDVLAKATRVRSYQVKQGVNVANLAFFVNDTVQ